MTLKRPQGRPRRRGYSKTRGYSHTYSFSVSATKTQHEAIKRWARGYGVTVSSYILRCVGKLELDNEEWLTDRKDGYVPLDEVKDYYIPKGNAQNVAASYSPDGIKIFKRMKILRRGGR